MLHCVNCRSTSYVMLCYVILSRLVYYKRVGCMIKLHNSYLKQFCSCIALYLSHVAKPIF